MAASRNYLISLVAYKSQSAAYLPWSDQVASAKPDSPSPPLNVCSTHQPTNKLTNQQTFSDGIFFVPLQPVGTPSGIVAAIAQATNFQFYSDVPPEQQLLDYLHKKEMLLVLDNFEHLLDGVALVSAILAAASRVKIVATSREALKLQEEWFHPVAGMSFPSQEESEHSVLVSYDAAQFFIQNAHRARVGFSPEDEAQQIIRICQLVDGMPLRLELAASWLKVLTCAQIADEIASSLDILSARHQNVPDRHRSMRAVMEQSWQLLAEQEQNVLKRLSVFRGGFRQEAATEVAGASLLTLAILVEKSLVNTTANGRYQIHELLRQFAAEMLADDVQEEAATRERHGGYYADFLARCQTILHGPELLTALNELGAEINNVRVSWQWAIEQTNLDVIEQTVDVLYHFYQIRSRFQEGEELFAAAARHLQTQVQVTTPPANERRVQSLLNRLTIRRAAFCHKQGNFHQARQHLQTVRTDEPGELAFMLRVQGSTVSLQENKSAARAYFLKSLTISRTHGDQIDLIESLDALANHFATTGRPEDGKQLAEEAIVSSRQVGRPDLIARTLHNLAFCLSNLGLYSDAETHWKECLVISERIDNPDGIATALNFLGWNAYCVGGDRLQEAVEYHERSLAICRKHDIRHSYEMLMADLSLPLIELEKYTRAQQCAQESLTVAKATGNLDIMPYALYCMGAATCGLSNLQTSRKYLVKAVELGWQNENLWHTKTALYFLAQLLYAESGLDTLTESVKMQKKAQALELLTLLIIHPDTYLALKSRVAQFQNVLESQLPADVVAASNARGASLTLDEAVTEILEVNSPMTI